MEWLADNPPAAKGVAALILMAIAATGFWLGRKRMIVAVPFTLAALFVAGIILPSAIPARFTAQRNNCIENLRQIRNAKEEWARENNKQPQDVPTLEELTARGSNQRFLTNIACPAGGDYTIGKVSEAPRCTLGAKGHRLY